MKHKRLILTSFVMVVLAGALIWVGGCGTENDKTKARVKIGVLTPLSGEASAYGTYTREGLELFLAEITDPQFELVYQDTKADPLEAMRLFKELKRANVSVVIGPFTSTEVRQIGPEATRTKTALITSSATADDLSKLGEYVFMMLPPNSQQGSDQARFALATLKVKKAAALNTGSNRIASAVSRETRGIRG